MKGQDSPAQVPTPLPRSTRPSIFDIENDDDDISYIMTISITLSCITTNFSYTFAILHIVMLINNLNHLMNNDSFSCLGVRV